MTLMTPDTHVAQLTPHMGQAESTFLESHILKTVHHRSKLIFARHPKIYVHTAVGDITAISSL